MQVTAVACLDKRELQRCGVNQYSDQVEMMSPPNQPLTEHICNSSRGRGQCRKHAFDVNGLDI